MARKGLRGTSPVFTSLKMLAIISLFLVYVSVYDLIWHIVYLDWPCDHLSWYPYFSKKHPGSLIRGVASLNLKYALVEQNKCAKKGTYYTDGVDPDETPQKKAVSHQVCAVCQYKHTLGNGRL